MYKHSNVTNNIYLIATDYVRCNLLPKKKIIVDGSETVYALQITGDYVYGYLKGEVSECPTCKQTTEIWSRITGYYRPLKNWNNGKLSEYNQRKEYEFTPTFNRANKIK